MVTLAALWLPIVLAAVAVFLVSSVVHMALPIHKHDYRRLPREEETLEQLRRAPLPPGIYFFPFHASAKELADPGARERYEKGPVGMLTVRPNGVPSMGRFLALWFLYCLVVSLFAAYLAGRTLPPGTDYLAVFRVAGTAAFLAWGIGELPGSIWRGAPWRVTLKHVADGLLYALVTAGVFGWLWPR
ncbi:MAG: hypothetical protein KJ058_14945 [Thermoanaerobaculia bacterium]|nr:hypothetical protein [Thermoanaerobaculia bacterium]MCZ7650302.1 hypothetical protein [Thermoanaerobaculia bacterium]